MPRLLRLIPALIIVSGVSLLIMKVYADGEPGGIPILLILIGLTWLLLSRGRARKPQ